MAGATNGHHPHDPEYWMAYLAAAMAHAAEADSFGAARLVLRSALDKFMRSECCSVHLAERIRSPKGGK